MEANVGLVLVETRKSVCGTNPNLIPQNILRICDNRNICTSQPESLIRHLILSCQLQHWVHHEFYVWNGKRKSNFTDSNIAELAHISPWLYERNTLHESPEAIYLIRYSYPRQRYGKSIRYENFMLCSLEVSRSVCEYRKSDLVFERKYRI